MINSRSRLQKPKREPYAYCDAPTPNPDDQAIMTIRVRILAEVRPELEWFMALQNAPPRMACKLAIQRPHTLCRDGMPRRFPRPSITLLASDAASSHRKRNMQDLRHHSHYTGNPQSR
jgi:hypothetical protein